MQQHSSASVLRGPHCVVLLDELLSSKEWEWAKQESMELQHGADSYDKHAKPLSSRARPPRRPPPRLAARLAARRALLLAGPAPERVVVPQRHVRRLLAPPLAAASCSSSSAAALHAACTRYFTLPSSLLPSSLLHMVLTPRPSPPLPVRLRRSCACMLN